MAAMHVQIMVVSVPINASMPVSPFVVQGVSVTEVPFLIVAIMTSSKEKVVVAHVVVPAPVSMSTIPQFHSLSVIEKPMAVINHLSASPLTVIHPDVPIV